MRILIVNPNTTASMTAKIDAAAKAVAATHSKIISVNPLDGPVSIEGYYDEAFSVPGMLDLMREHESTGIDAYVIACFDDSGLGAAREAVNGPVISIGEAAMHAACFLGTGFSIVTTLPRSIPILEDNAVRYGFGRHCRKVRAASVPVLALEEPGSDAQLKIRDEAARALQEDGSDVIVLGCAGMADLARWLSSELKIPVIDGVGAAVKFAESMVDLGLTTSKAGAYAPPGAKEYKGLFSGSQPH